MSVYLQDPDVTIHQGDVLDVLRELPSESVHMCCTSPPFYGLRDYGTDGQIGLEATPDEWVARLVDVFREVKRVLRDDGTLWVEIGDSYSGGTPGGSLFDKGRTDGRGPGRSDGLPGYDCDVPRGRQPRPPVPGMKPKDLIGAPWLLAFALRADGWYLRSEIIWAKPNPMPESVTDRPTTSHSRVFLLAKNPRYFYDAEALREPHSPDGRTVTNVHKGNGSLQHRDGERWPGNGRNRRSVWTIPTQPYPEAHFATWPEALCRDMILAGCPEGGTVLDCFGGSGTTALVARKLGRRAVLIELNADYCALAARRLQQQSLFA